MQYKKDSLYKEIHRRCPHLSVEYIEQYINFILDEIKEWSIHPTNLRLNVRNFGSFYWKHQNLKKDAESKSFFTGDEYKRSEEHVRFLSTANVILDRYKDYVDEKQRIRKLNYGADYKTPEELTILRREFLNKANEIKNNTKVLI